MSEGTEAATEDVPQVVFACVRKRRQVRDQPGETIHPEVAEALGRLGLDTSRERPRMLTREDVASSDLAVTLGCGEECPYVPGVQYVDWPVDDPGGQDEATVQRIIADLDVRVRDLLAELVPDIDLSPSILRDR